MYSNKLNTLQLHTLMTHSKVVIFDCRHDLMNPAWGLEQYTADHITGAYFAGIDTHLSGVKTGHNGRHPLPKRETLIQWLASCGVNPDTQVVCYDQADGAFAARLWWLCRYAGLYAVAVLEGGFEAWKRSQASTCSDAPTPCAQPHIWNLPHKEHIVTADQLLTLIQSASTVLIDARAPERFLGKVEPIDPVAGHIPSAVNHFFKQNLTANGEFNLQAKDMFLSLLDKPSISNVIHSCGSGVTACHNILTMHVLGLTQTHQASELYAGGWSEWCANTARPCVTNKN